MFPNSRDWDNHSAVQTERNKNPKFCLCDSLKITLYICRIFGLCPISWKHIEGKCVFSISKIWILYSLLLAGIEIFHFINNALTMKISFVNDRKLIIEYISIINDNISTITIVLMMLLNIFRVKKLVKMYNKCSSLSKRDLLCESNLRINKMVHMIFVVAFTILYIVQYVAIFMLNMMDNFDTNWTHTRLLMPIVQNTPLLFSVLVGITCAIFTTMLTCYEKIMMLHLKFTPVHPMPDFDETCQSSTILGVYTYKKCKNCHKLPNDITLNKLQVVEYLKWLHEKIRDCVELANVVFSPHMLVYMTFEIIALVLHWYTVIVYFTTTVPEPTESTVNFFNWLFVTVHSTALFIFLDKAQNVETAVSQF